MGTPFSGANLPKARRFVGSSVEAGEGEISTVPASCIFQRITCVYCVFGEENERPRPIDLIPKRALAHQENSILYGGLHQKSCPMR